jgi:hypothetical protein
VADHSLAHYRNDIRIATHLERILMREGLEKAALLTALFAGTLIAAAVIQLLRAPTQIALAYLWVWRATDLSHYFM